MYFAIGWQAFLVIFRIVPQHPKAFETLAGSDPASGALPQSRFLTTSVTLTAKIRDPTSSWEDISVKLRRSSKYHFLPIHNVPGRGQQHPILTMHRVECPPLAPPETPDGGPTFLQSHPGVVCHGLLPCPSHCLSDHKSCLASRYPSAASRVPQWKKGPIGPSS